MQFGLVIHTRLHLVNGELEALIIKHLLVEFDLLVTRRLLVVFTLHLKLLLAVLQLHLQRHNFFAVALVMREQ